MIAETIEEAEHNVEQEFFRDDLLVLESEGIPLWDGSAPIELRPATAEEAARAHIAIAGMQVSNQEGPLEEGAVIFLVPVVDPTDEDEDDN